MSRLVDLATRLSPRRVAIVGDVMLDHFLIGRVDRISPEAPVPIVRVDRDEYRLGGAANVAHNIRALGADAALVGLVGDDEAARLLRREMMTSGIPDTWLVVDRERPTTRKVRVVSARNQQVARLDYEQDADPSSSTAAALVGELASAIRGAEVVVVSDYRKGAVTPALITAAADAATAAGVPLLVDPKVPAAERYRGATLVTPNHHEAELMTGRTIRTAEDARDAARTLHARSGASVLITWGEHGMWLLDANTAGGGYIEERLPTAAREVSDVTGAGDTVIAVLALACAAGATLSEAARLANLAAGLVVARFGPAVVSRDELAAAIADMPRP
jgi:D-beta-D-heptose 7-phosphate kinase/D-beta-D-heptose 1-phosphate adenosyltransferase